MNDPAANRWSARSVVVLVAFVLLAAALCWRAVQLQVSEGEFLLAQGDARHLRTVEVSAHRGMILDRHGEPLAASTPVDSLWAVPADLLAGDGVARVAVALDLDPAALEASLRTRSDRSFAWLRRHLPPDEAQAVMAMDIPGVHSEREYRRYYPAAEVTGHLIGFTNVDDVGQEGVELAFDEWLRGESGSKRVLRDRTGRVVADVQSLVTPRPGRDLYLSLDRRIQYLAYRELQSAVMAHGARSGSLVVLDARTGEVLAMVNQPAFNPNNRQDRAAERYRNRALTDVLEPGSSFKPFVIAAALDSGDWNRRSTVNTGGGLLQVRGGTVRDTRGLGTIDLATLLSRSSNVGASMVALSLDPERLWTLLNDFGFGQPTGIGFPGEQSGLLSHHTQWREFGLATLSFGYGVSATPVQLAQAYGVIAADGLRIPMTLLRREEAAVPTRVLDASVARDLRVLMEAGTGGDGTAGGARVHGYRIAGKTGTVRKAEAGGYSTERHIAVFAGMAPASDPRLVAVVVIDEPSRGAYYGGDVAAPVFGRVMSGALRLLDIQPDALNLRGSMIAAGARP